MSRVFWDTMLFVYLLEDHPEYGTRAKQMLESIEARNDELCTSTLVLGEILTGFYRRKAFAEASQVRRAFEEIPVNLIPFDAKAAVRFATIRAELGIRPADAIHLACAAEANTDVMVTHDRALAGKKVPGVGFIVGLDTDIFGAGPEKRS